MSNLIMRNTANNAQARIPKIKKPRSIFPMDKSRKQTFKASYLIPIFFEEVLPGDTWNINMKALIRLMPQVAPPIDNLTISTFFFFDPIRLEWENFPKQHGERKNPDDTIDYISPKISTPSGGFAIKSLQDYLGKPTGVECKTTAFGERMYNRIWNQYFRSEWLQNSVYENNSDTDDDYTNYTLLKISKNHDYFTDCLPSITPNDQAITIPLGTRAEVYGDGLLKFTNNSSTDTTAPSYLAPNGSWNSNGYRNAVLANPGGTTQQTADNGQRVLSKADCTRMTQTSGLYTDLSNATAATISSLRWMLDTQTLLERDMRSGTRYTEILESRYGTINPDLRLQRVQYLGGTRTPLFTTPVVQTSGTTSGGTVQGNLAGYGITTEGANVIKASFGEFGHIMGLIAITATPQYQYGRHRKFNRWERFDYMYPEFQGMSDQAVTNSELFAQDDTITDSITGGAVNDEPWGFIGRYDEYRYFNNEVCGMLKSQYTNSLDVWTYAENMSQLQNLNGTFIEDKTDKIVARSMAVQYTTEGGETVEEDQFLGDFNFVGTVTRVLTSKAVPQTGGRIL